MPNCVVRGCLPTRKKRDSSVILHGFPREPEKIKLWLHQTGQYGSDIDDMVVKVYLGKVNDSYRMCSLHFTNDSYRYDGYRRTLKKTAIPTIFNSITPSTVLSSVSSNIPSVSGPSSSSSEQQIPSAPFADSQKPSSTATVHAYRVEFPVTNSKASLQPTIQQMTLVPVVPQHVFFQACGVSQNPDSIVGDKSSSPIQPTNMQIPSALSGVSQQSSKTIPSTSVILEVPVSLSSCATQSKSGISELTASSHGGQLQQKSSSSVSTNSNLPLDTQLWPEATSLSTTTSCSKITLSPASCPLMSTAAFDKTLNAQPTDIPLTVVSETNPCSTTVLPVSGNVSSVTQTPPTSALPHKPPPISVFHIPLKTPTSQMVPSNCLPPSKKRKLEPSAASSSGQIIFPKPCISQPTVNTGNLYFLSNSAPLVQTSCLIQKPLMVDKGVNTDFSTNRKSCCVGTDLMYRRRNARTQTKIYTKDRKIMCTLLVPNEETDDSSVSDVSPEDIELKDPSPSSSSDNDNEPCEDLETVNLDFVKVEIVSDSEVDAFVHSTLAVKQENDSSAGQVFPSPTYVNSNFKIPEFDMSTLMIEPTIKTEHNQFPISKPSQDFTHFVSQNPKIERISPIPHEHFSPVYKPTLSWETSAIQTDDESEDFNDNLFCINELSEDEDESFLVPSDAEDEDDIKHVFQDLDSPVENLVEEEKYIVFESCLKKLIMMIPCRSETKCMSPLTQYRKETVGSYLSVEARCSSGHTSLLWESQPRHGYEPLGNVLLSAAVLFSGSSFVKSQHMFKLINLKSIDKTTYSRNQSMYLFPTINHHWKEEQKAVIQSVQERPLCLAGDQQLDNPGFSANYSTYSLMDVASKKICSFSIEPLTPQVTLEGLEKIGFQKTMEELQTMNADVKKIVTGRSVAVQEILTDRYPRIVHQLDLWHLFRSIGDDILVAAKHKDCEILYQWVEAIRNHLWWSLCTCCKNPDLLIKKWKSVIHHVTNIHEWDGDSDCRACHHPPLPEEVVNNTNWLEKGSAAHEQLKNIVENTSLLKDLKQLSFHCHTGELEIYHKTCLKYHPKSLHFFKDSMVARTQLAALDHNRNVHTVKTLVKTASSGYALGSMTQRLEISKSQKSWIMKALYKPTCQNFIFDIMNDVIALVKEEKTFQ
ncbi:uncharacterized protein LOC130277739 isoform X2 [Hyla sarda]|nr:uncharacterized protein LOC130277739 isoform X2 [Hyla sarda]